MMKYNNSWDAIRNPGETFEYFKATFRGIDSLKKEFCPVNAWWLSELSRLTYKYGGEIRKNILEQYGFFNILEIKNGRSCGIFCSGTDINEILFHIFVFKGTDSIEDWIGNFKLKSVKWKSCGNVHKGFVEAYELIRNEVLEISKGKNNIFLTGHSLGGAIAQFAATDINKEKINSIYTFGSPKVGNKDFNMCLKDICTYHIINSNDLVPKVPSLLKDFNDFEHAGEKFYFDECGQLYKENNISDKTDCNEDLEFFLNGKKLLQPPRFVSDHAPVNYVANIYNYILTNKNEKF